MRAPTTRPAEPINTHLVEAALRQGGPQAAAIAASIVNAFSDPEDLAAFAMGLDPGTAINLGGMLAGEGGEEPPDGPTGGEG